MDHAIKLNKKILFYSQIILIGIAFFNTTFKSNHLKLKSYGKLIIILIFWGKVISLVRM